MFKKTKKIIIAVLFSVGIFSVAGFVMAATPDLGLSYGNSIGLTATDPRTIIVNIIRVALGFLGIVAIGLIIYGGFLWMTASGNEQQIDKAKKVLISAIIGLLIILSAFGIATFVLNSLSKAIGTTSSNNDSGNNNLQNTTSEGGSCNASSLGTCIPVQDCADGLTCGSDCICHSVSCNSSSNSSVCSVDDDLCGGNGWYCDNNCACQEPKEEGESCDSNTANAQCDAKGSMCDSTKNLYCDTTNTNDSSKYCTCQPGDGEGQPCGSNTSSCSSGQTVCSSGLTCDTSSDGNSCTCQKLPAIDWVSPQGGFCLNNINVSCTSDGDCGSSKCATSTPNAASGNIISIGGEYFGTSTGEVYFYDGTGSTKSGTNPATVNALCTSYWTDNEIIVVVPSGVQTGPIKIVRADGKTDLTNDSRGSNIEDLVINNISRPGLCGISISEGKTGDTVEYNGVHFSNSSYAKFGNYESSVAAKNSIFASVNGDANVPSISSGETTTFVYSGEQGSNFLKFHKLSDTQAGSYIASFNPTTGTSSQYVTISGSGFGSTQGTSKVYFGASSGGHEASYSFPDICADSVWGAKQIIVKVPDNIPAGYYPITIVLSNGTELSTSPNTFQVSKSAVLAPSLCKISPAAGETGTIVDLWGENFDAVDQYSKVRFSSGKDVSGFTADDWKKDTSASGIVKPYKVETKVPTGASSGQVAIVKNSPESVGNGLNFEVGSCLDSSDPDSACGTQKCCAEGTQKAGVCVNNIATDCSSTASTSVYEFGFNTSFSQTSSSNTSGSCTEGGLCSLGGYCPNSPGVCSLFSPSNSSEKKSLTNKVYCGNDVCQSKTGCGASASTCAYSSSINRCVDSSRPSCNLASTTVNGSKTYNTYCGGYRTALDNNIHYSYMFQSSLSCLGKYSSAKDLDGNSICVDTNSSCKVCQISGQSCLDDGESGHIGVCGSDDVICPSGSSCDSGECKVESLSSCDCCCNKHNSDKDCCTGLTCEGACGADTSGTDYGSCGGCTKYSGSGSVDQNSSDLACNCTGTTGKYCDTNNSDFPTGVCRDCAQLSSNSTSCSQHNSCCVDHTKSDDCVNRVFDSDGNLFSVISKVVNGSSVNYCGYYQCDSAGTACDSGGAVYDPNSSNGYFPSSSECASQCKAQAKLGDSCASSNTSSKDCDASICSSPFSCLQSDGTTGTSGSCGICCCNPAESDQCSSLTEGKSTTLKLVCKADVGPCSGSERGLCCGCTQNDDCVPLGAQKNSGCGSDSCCRARPNVADVSPINGATDICTNAQVSADFDQVMDISSFSNNVMIVGKYSGDCPSGTVYVAKVDKSIMNNPFFRVASNVLNGILKFLGRETFAATDSYCAISGVVSGTQNSNGTTKLTINSSNLMAPDTDYYVIIKGSSASDNSSSSVRDAWGIDLNSLSSPVDNSKLFNGISYSGSYIWTFHTRANSNGNPEGVCSVDHAVITPDSYLFKTTIADANENDINSPVISSAANFDTITDSDKVFTAKAISSSDDGSQILHPVEGYAWTWNWTMENTSIAGLVPGVQFVDSTGNELTDSSKQLIRATTGITDNHTRADAAINMISPASAVDISASSSIYVFVCDNPWPPVNSDGTWSPWQDSSYNCSASTALGLPCSNNFNYILYYCRDNGGGPTSDLPTLSGNITRGTSLSCTDSSGNCNSKSSGDSCGSSGTCQPDPLKESYFFQGEVPASQIVLSASVLAAGGAVNFSWGAVNASNGVKVVKYKLYYGEASGAPYANSVEVATSSSPHYSLSGLTNSKIYYAAATAIYKNGAESDYSSEINFTPEDTSAPSQPTLLTPVASGNKINVYWNANTDDTVSYKLYYGIVSGQYGSVPKTVEGRSATTTSFTFYSSDSTYYISLTAIDSFGNESTPAKEVSIKP
jgi:hypothetical protein